MNRISDSLGVIDEQVAGPGGMAGIQLFTRTMGRSITDPSFDAIFEKMAQIEKPIWLHPVFDERRSDNNLTYSCEYELTVAMDRLVANGIFKR